MILFTHTTHKNVKEISQSWNGMNIIGPFWMLCSHPIMIHPKWSYDPHPYLHMSKLKMKGISVFGLQGL